MIQTKILIPLFLLILVLLASCENSSNQSKMNDTETAGKISTTFSTDISILAKLLNFNTYRPTQVKFKYTFVDNSSTEDRTSVPGPSDSELEAVIYYDSITFQKIVDLYKDTLTIYPNYSKLQFDFDWLDDSISHELLNCSENYYGHPDAFLGTGNSGELWFLHNKILIYDISN